MGRFGPSLLKYGGFLKQEVRVSPKYAGIQLWTVPTSGIWAIEARGASGAYGILAGSAGNKKRGGYGAVAKAKFQLYAGKVLNVLVGQEGSRDFTHSHRPGGGGGGTFVVYQDGRPLMVAGGGGGGGIPRASKQCLCTNNNCLCEREKNTNLFLNAGLHLYFSTHCNYDHCDFSPITIFCLFFNS